MTTSYRRFKNEEALPCSAIADHQSTLVIRKICRQGGDLSQARNSRFALEMFSVLFRPHLSTRSQELLALA